jgi:hypothetical protein
MMSGISRHAAFLTMSAMAFVWWSTLCAATGLE